MAIKSTERWIGRRSLTVCVCLGLIAAAREAQGVTVFQKSAYTVLDRKACQDHLCPGLDGFPIYLLERDGRTFVASGTNPKKSQAAQQSLAASNTPFAPATDRATIEWRFVIRDNRKMPFAMIVRYFTQQKGRAGEVLVVTRIAGAESCHVAYIDALATTNAIVVARKIADSRARTFDCKSAVTVDGERGLSPM